MSRSVVPVAGLMLAPMLLWLLVEARQPPSAASPVVCASSVTQVAAPPVDGPAVMFLDEAGVIVDRRCSELRLGCPGGDGWRVDAVGRQISKSAEQSPGMRVEMFDDRGQPCADRLGDLRWVTSLPDARAEELGDFLDTVEDNPEAYQSELRELVVAFAPVLVAEVSGRCEGARWARPIDLSKRTDRSTVADISPMYLHGHTLVHQWDAFATTHAVVRSPSGILRHIRRRGRSTEVVASSPLPGDEPCTQ